MYNKARAKAFTHAFLAKLKRHQSCIHTLLVIHHMVVGVCVSVIEAYDLEIELGEYLDDVDLLPEQRFMKEFHAVLFTSR